MNYKIYSEFHLALQSDFPEDFLEVYKKYKSQLNIPVFNKYLSNFFFRFADWININYLKALLKYFNINIYTIYYNYKGNKMDLILPQNFIRILCQNRENLYLVYAYLYKYQQNKDFLEEIAQYRYLHNLIKDTKIDIFGKNIVYTTTYFALNLDEDIIWELYRNNALPKEIYCCVDSIKSRIRI